jgi:hypothetical protein
LEDEFVKSETHCVVLSILLLVKNTNNGGEFTIEQGNRLSKTFADKPTRQDGM